MNSNTTNMMNSTRDSKVSKRPKKKLNLTIFLLGMGVFIFLVIIIIANYENHEDPKKDGSTIFKPIFGFIICLIILMKIYQSMYSNQTIGIFQRFTIDKGLLIYLLLAIMVAFLI